MRVEDAVVAFVGSDTACLHVDLCAILGIASEPSLAVDAVAAPADVLAVEDLLVSVLPL
jgi:hypothetical protein